AKTTRGGRAGTKTRAAAPTAEEAPAAEATEPAAEAAQEAPTAEAAPAAAAPSITDLGLPTTVEEIRTYLGGYAGVGARTAESLVDRFGDGVFEALQSQPEEVVKLLGERRARSVIDQWISDFDRRSGERTVSA